MTDTDEIHVSQKPRGTFRLLILVGVLIGTIILMRFTPLADAFKLSEVPKLRDWLLQFGAASQVVFLAVGIATLVGGLPRAAVAAVAGALFGPFLGTLWAETAALLAGFAGFAFARWLAGDTVHHHLARRPHLDHQLRENGIVVVLLIRLFPVGHNQLTNFICGVSPVSARDFLWGSLFGLFPQTLAYALLGASVIEHPWLRLTLGAGLLVALCAGSWWLYRSSHRVAQLLRPAE